MGLIDNDVIAESQKSSSSTPQPQYTQTYYQNQGYQQNANTNPYGNNGQQFQQQQQAPPPPPSYGPESDFIAHAKSTLAYTFTRHAENYLKLPTGAGSVSATIMTITPEEELN